MFLLYYLCCYIGMRYDVIVWLSENAEKSERCLYIGQAVQVLLQPYIY